MRQRVIEWLKQNMPPERVTHILGVEKMCIQLAKRHGVDIYQAATAGLLHDLAKFFPPQRLLQMARENGIELDEITSSHPHLLHADVSAIVAKKEFGVDNEEILVAISNHTLGRPQMSKLSCIVFIADKLEESRGDTPQLNLMRQVSHENLMRGLRMVCDYSICDLLQRCKVIHPRTILTRNWALSHP